MNYKEMKLEISETNNNRKKGTWKRKKAKTETNWSGWNEERTVFKLRNISYCRVGKIEIPQEVTEA